MNRLKELRNEKGINQDVLAKLLCMEVAGYSKLETERVPLKDEYIIKLADYFNVSTDYLLGKTDIRNINNISKANDNMFIVPVLGKITAGQPILAEEYIEGYLPVDPDVYGLKNSEDLFYLRVSGQSMNLKIKNGDYALIKKQDTAEDGDIVVAIVNSDDEATLKRYRKLNEQFVLLEPMSTDTSIQAITIDLKDTKFKIIGKAIGQFGKF